MVQVRVPHLESLAPALPACPLKRNAISRTPSGRRFQPASALLVHAKVVSEAGPGGEAYLTVLYVVESMPDGSLRQISCGNDSVSGMVRRWALFLSALDGRMSRTLEPRAHGATHGGPCVSPKSFTGSQCYMLSRAPAQLLGQRHGCARDSA